MAEPGTRRGGEISSSSSSSSSRRDSSGRCVVTLQVPRPETDRRTNEYVDTPLRYKQTLVPVHHENNNKKKEVSGAGVGAITRQPGLKKPAATVGESVGGSGRSSSIICKECGKCRCQACREPRQPPSAWLCQNMCYCSVDSCVDYVSCLCCVKGLMYHVEGSEEGRSAADDPCSCTGRRWLCRWSCLALSSLFLPCLCCYCPLKTCATSCERLYASYSDRGCSCSQQQDHGALLTP